MTSPYATPAMLKNLAPLGIDWDSIPSPGCSPAQNLAALLDICYVASDAVDTECFQPLRATCDLEELVGPNDRLVVDNGNGNGIARMQHWPIIQALGAQISQAAVFPPQWQQLSASQLIVNMASSQFVGGSAIGSSASDGMNEIAIQPGYVNWGNGRNGYRAQIAYINGWPTAGILPATSVTGDCTFGDDTVTVSSTVGIVVGAPISSTGYFSDGTVVKTIGSGTIQASSPAIATGTTIPIDIGYAPGVSSLNVDDVTGMAGTRPTIYDGGLSESVLVTGAAANTPVEVYSGLYAQAGEGVLTLASPTRRAHTGTEPSQALIQAIPANVRLACYYFAGAEALQRGGTAFTVQALPGSMQSMGGSPSIGDMTAMAREQLKNFHRVF